MNDRFLPLCVFTKYRINNLSRSHPIEFFGTQQSITWDTCEKETRERIISLLVFGLIGGENLTIYQLPRFLLHLSTNQPINPSTLSTSQHS